MLQLLKHPTDICRLVRFKNRPTSRKLQYRWLCMQVLLHRYLYYVVNSPVLSDLEYDRLEETLAEYERVHPGLRHPESPTLHPGSTLELRYPSSVVRVGRQILAELASLPACSSSSSSLRKTKKKKKVRVVRDKR